MAQTSDCRVSPYCQTPASSMVTNRLIPARARCSALAASGAAGYKVFLQKKAWAMVILLIAAAQLCSCSMSKDMTMAEQAVAQFHERLNNQQDDAIYDAADAAYKNAITRETNHGFLSRIRRKLGTIKTSSKTNFRLNIDTNGTFVNLAYKTECANGEADETFVWRVEGGHVTLVGYHVNSPLMLTD